MSNHYIYLWESRVMKKICRVLFFAVLLIGTVLSADLCLMPDGMGVSSLRNCYKNANVLFFGSSHIFCNVNAGTLWNERGIASCSLAQPEQPVYMSYYQMKNSFKYDVPEVAVLEVYMAVVSEKYNQSQIDSHYTYALLTYPIYKDFKERVEAAEFLENDKTSFILGLPTYHSSYKNVVKNNEDIYAGFQYRFDVNEDGQCDTRYKTDDISLGEARGLSKETEEYLGKMKTLCEQNGVKLLLLVTPYQAAYEHMCILKAVEDWAEKNDVDFLDMNNYVADIGIDLDTEMYDWGHARMEGNVKNSGWLAKYLAENYNVSNHKGNSGYERWDDVYKFMHEEIQRNEGKYSEFDFVNTGNRR